MIEIMIERWTNAEGETEACLKRGARTLEIEESTCHHHEGAAQVTAQMVYLRQLQAQPVSNRHGFGSIERLERDPLVMSQTESLIRTSHGSRWRESPSSLPHRRARSIGVVRHSFPSSWPHGDARVRGPSPRSPESADRAARPRRICLGQHRHLHHHDLSDRGTPRKPLRFHLKRRRTEINK